MQHHTTLILAAAATSLLIGATATHARDGGRGGPDRRYRIEDIESPSKRGQPDITAEKDVSKPDFRDRLPESFKRRIDKFGATRFNLLRQRGR